MMFGRIGWVTVIVITILISYFVHVAGDGYELPCSSQWIVGKTAYHMMDFTSGNLEKRGGPDLPPVGLVPNPDIQTATYFDGLNRVLFSDGLYIDRTSVILGSERAIVLQPVVIISVAEEKYFVVIKVKNSNTPSQLTLKLFDVEYINGNYDSQLLVPGTFPANDTDIEPSIGNLASTQSLDVNQKVTEAMVVAKGQGNGPNFIIYSVTKADGSAALQVAIIYKYQLITVGDPVQAINVVDKLLVYHENTKRLLRGTTTGYYLYDFNTLTGTITMIPRRVGPILPYANEFVAAAFSPSGRYIYCVDPDPFWLILRRYNVAWNAEDSLTAGIGIPTAKYGDLVAAPNGDIYVGAVNDNVRYNCKIYNPEADPIIFNVIAIFGLLVAGCEGSYDYDTAARFSNPSFCVSKLGLNSQSRSASVSPSDTPSNTPSVTSSRSISATPSNSRTVTVTPSSSRTPTSSKSESRSPTRTSTRTRSASTTSSNSMSMTSSKSPTRSTTSSNSFSETSAISRSTTRSESISKSNTRSGSESKSVTSSPTTSDSITPSASDSRIESLSPTPTVSLSKSLTASRSVSNDASSTKSFSNTRSASISSSLSKTESKSGSSSRSPSSTHTPTKSVTNSKSESKSKTETPSESFSTTITRTSSISTSSSRTESQTPSSSRSTSLSPSASSSSTISLSTSKSETSTISNSLQPSVTKSKSASNSGSRSESDTITATRTETGTGSETRQPSTTRTSTRTVSNSKTSSKSLTSSRTLSTSSSRSRSNSKSHSVSKSFVQVQIPSLSNQVSLPSASSTVLRAPSSSTTVSRSSSSTVSNTASKSASTSSAPSFSRKVADLPSNSSTKSSLPMMGPSDLPTVTLFTQRTNTASSTSIPTRINPFRSASRTPNRGNGDTVVVNDDGDVVGVINPGSGPGIIDAKVTRDLPPIDPNSGTVGSPVVDVTLVDEFGNPLKFSGNAEICLKRDTNSKEDGCLGYLDETVSPAEWKCQDPCLKSSSTHDGLVCGSTSHFTNFAILLGGSGGNGCGNSGDNYIFDAGWKDAVLLATTTIGITCCMLLIAVFLMTPAGKRFWLSEEARRIQALRYGSEIHEVSIADSD